MASYWLHKFVDIIVFITELDMYDVSAKSAAVVSPGTTHIAIYNFL